jgi:hypothetical protein
VVDGWLSRPEDINKQMRWAQSAIRDDVRRVLGALKAKAATR